MLNLYKGHRYLPKCVLSLAALVMAAAALAAANNTAALSRITEDVQYLASDELQGRGVGTVGLEKAADYIRDRFKQVGLEGGAEDGSYFQPFRVLVETKIIKPQTSLVLEGPDGQRIDLELGKDYQPIVMGGAGQVSAPIVFAGYGISAEDLKYDDYAGADVEGKVVLIIRREPQQDNPDSAFDGKEITHHSYVVTKLAAAKEQGAAAVLLVNDPFTTSTESEDQLVPPDAFGGGSVDIPFAHLKQAVVNQLLEKQPLRALGEKKLEDLAAVESYIDKHHQPVTQPLEGWTARLEINLEKVYAQVKNVVGVLEGEGPLSDETVIIGAHYDHLGYGGFGSLKPTLHEIHNGADDNASGTAALIELARRFAEREEKPARRLVFIAFSAEERGLIGSNYYVEHPLYPLDKTIAMFNFDMVGRLRDDKLTVYGTETATEFEEIIAAVNAEHTLELNPVGGVIASSDHYGFFQKEIPVIHFFSGFSEEYHTPEDDVELLNIEGILRVVDYAEDLISAVAQLPRQPEYVAVKATTPGRGDMAYLGVVPDYSAEVDGLRLTGVNGDSPAEKGGLEAGDIIIKFGEVPVADIQGLANGLRRYKPGQEVPIVVRRGDKELTLPVTLGKPRGH